MYRCHMEFYLINCRPEVLETLRELPPLTPFWTAASHGSFRCPGPM